ncbi:hypothetical protein B0W48_19730 [Pseudoalteromonas aliena]|jgi:hypothetical protein|uniref:Uncharacterized protein n=1 Tax=Pseudoalteromonas aliena TaxID=247523 RepID=A0A1Q2H371_9GAMM|nr:hypothetical protein B0W48_19730 [Pseudoalteromonas aliena]
MKKHSPQLTKRLWRTKPIINYLKFLFKTQLESRARAVIASENRLTGCNSRIIEIDLIPTLYTLYLKIKCFFVHSPYLGINNE